MVAHRGVGAHRVTGDAGPCCDLAPTAHSLSPLRLLPPRHHRAAVPGMRGEDMRRIKIFRPAFMLMLAAFCFVLWLLTFVDTIHWSTRVFGCPLQIKASRATAGLLLLDPKFSDMVHACGYDSPALGLLIGTEGVFFDVHLPLWLVAILLVFLAAQLRCRSRSRDARLCAKCGYSLIGNVSGVCLECGTPVSSAPPAATAPGSSAPGTPEPW